MTHYFKIHYDEVNQGLSLRYLIEDTIEERGLAEVINVGTGDGYFDMTLRCESESIPQIRSLLQSMGMGASEIMSDQES